MADPVTLQTVADAANVSVSTASRALRGDPVISEDSAARVRDAASSLNYRPLRRRKPAEQKTAHSPLAGKRLAVVTLGMDRSLVSLPVIGASINGTEEALSSAGAQLQLLNVPDLSNVPASHRGLELDGAFLLGAMQGPAVAQCANPWVRKLFTIPHVWLLGRPEGCDGDTVGANDMLVGTLAADYLADHGHRHVAFLNPKPDHVLMMHRENGFIAQGLRRGLRVERYASAPPEGWTIPLKPPQTSESVQLLVDQLLEANPRPTALFAASDSVAAVAYGALSKRDIRIGRDISMISGNNDDALIAGLHPALTTFDIQPYEIGRAAVDQMARLLSMTATPPDSVIGLEPKLVERDSVRTLATKGK
ncbi:Ribose operon repressor [Planctomycetes bacterium Pan216]|uniref:Ribose operon repressor n=1 Tax=Kolteria novifilia TaxID=2527975 RepID=A0A518AZV5_9BACT|nr:Ribose operon repressor [Planctomycetes bacterium Pan216]